MADKYTDMMTDEVYEKACSLLEEGSLQEAAEIFKKLADDGNPLAQCDYGVCLVEGKGVEKNEEAAAEYWQKSADAGFPLAEHKLGICYLKGLCGLENNNDKAFEYFQKAADGGVKESMFNLAYCYQEGIGIQPDIKKSIEWMEKAADAKMPEACLNIGVLYLFGKSGVAKDEEKGFNFIRNAAESGLPHAQFMLGCCCESGHGAEKDLAEAAGWYRRAAKGGVAEANKSLERLGFPGVK